MMTRNRFLLSAAILLALSACNNLNGYKAVTDSARKEVADAGSFRPTKNALASKPYFYFNSPYIASSPVRSDRGDPLPAHLESHNAATLTDGGTIEEIANAVSTRYGLPTRVGNLTGSSKTASDSILQKRAQVSYAGTLSGLMDEIANVYGVYWTYQSGIISFYKYETRTFVLASMADDVTMTSNVTGLNGTGNSSSGGSSAGSTGGSVATEASAERSVEAKMKTDIFKEFEQAVQSFLPANSGITISRATGAITVTATPPVMRQVDRIVNEHNDRMLRQVEIEIRLVQIDASKLDELGLDLNAVISQVGAGVKLSAGGAVQNFATAAAKMGAAIVNPTSDGITSKLDGSTAFIRALSQIVDNTTTDVKTIVTMNNTPAVRQVMDSVSYLKSVQQTAVSSAGSQISLTPGTVITGYNLQFLPRVQSNGNVLLKVDLSISSLRSLETVASGGQQIQTPNVSSEANFQQVNLTSGQSMVISYLNRDGANVGERGIGKPSFWGLGGGYSARSNSIYSLLLITPRILEAPEIRQYGEYVRKES